MGHEFQRHTSRGGGGGRSFEGNFLLQIETDGAVLISAHNSFHSDS